DRYDSRGLQASGEGSGNDVGTVAGSAREQNAPPSPHGSRGAGAKCGLPRLPPNPWAYRGRRPPQQWAAGITSPRPPAGLSGFVEARYRAFLETITQLRPRLHRYCARMTGSVLDGEDVVQEALFQAYRRLETFDDARELAPWLFRIAHNCCIDFLRRRRVRE